MAEHTCKDCPDRYSGCHDHCEKYQASKAAKDKLKAKIREAKAKENLLHNYGKDSLNKHKKKKWR